jgi:hypothetical protein
VNHHTQLIPYILLIYSLYKLKISTNLMSYLVFQLFLLSNKASLTSWLNGNNHLFYFQMCSLGWDCWGQLIFAPCSINWSWWRLSRLRPESPEGSLVLAQLGPICRTPKPGMSMWVAWFAYHSGWILRAVVPRKQSGSTWHLCSHLTNAYSHSLSTLLVGKDTKFFPGS